MARKSKAETALTRKRIIEVAARAFKNNGIEATGVAEVMAAAGLTHGGFYRHFESKEQLVTEACASSMELMVEAAQTAAGQGDAAFLKHLESFITKDTRTAYLCGCPLVAMGSELARSDIETRRAVSQGYRQLIDIIAGRGSGDKAAKEDATFTLCSMIGAVTMAKIMDDPAFSEQILTIARKRLAEISTCVHKKTARSKAS